MARRRSIGGDRLTELAVKVFRLNGVFLNIAETLASGSGLTAARWQVLGPILQQPLTVAAIAREMGLTRQSVQRLADALVELGMCEYLPNPAHARASLLAPTKRGRAAIDRIRPRQAAWASKVGAAVGTKALDAANAAMDALLSVLIPRPVAGSQKPSRTPITERGKGRPSTDCRR
jgi:DNA-binding MarR family transcriptional regulator